MPRPDGWTEDRRGAACCAPTEWMGCNGRRPGETPGAFVGWGYRPTLRPRRPAAMIAYPRLRELAMKRDVGGLISFSLLTLITGGFPPGGIGRGHRLNPTP